MKKSTKILISVIAATLVLCIATIIGVSVSKNRDNEPSVTVSDLSQSENGQSSVSETTAAESTTAAPSLQQQLLGKWRDSANMSGFEFFEDGTVNVTYVNISVVNGTVKGTYTVSGNTLDVKFSIYTKTVHKSYEVSVIPETELTLKNKEDGDVSTYSYVKENVQQTSAVSSPDVSSEGIVGTWVDSDGSIKYSFNADSSVDISFNEAIMSSVSDVELNGAYRGIYMTNEDSMTVQFTMNETKVTQEFTYRISGNTLSLVDRSGETTLLVRKSAGSFSSNAGLVGKWTDGADMSGYNFRSDGTVDVTYVNFTVPVINTKIDGTYPGTYSVSGGRLTVNFSIYGKTITDTYEFSISGDTLTLKDVEDGKVSTYRRAG